MIKAAIFDKDGTLFDFRSSWGAWTRVMLAEITRTPQEAQDLAQRLGFDLQTGDFAPSSIVIAHTTDEIAQEIIKALPHLDLVTLSKQLESLAKSAPMVPLADLPVIFGALRAAGLKIGLATNDTEIPALHHLQQAGILPLFDFVAGCDSGWGGKPAPGQLLAFASACGLPANQIAMVGDSVHDLEAAQVAGMARVAVLTGIAGADDLAPHADVVLADISGLLDWITEQNAR
jgi:phosphoglycolate phosphatase